MFIYLFLFLIKSDFPIAIFLYLLYSKRKTNTLPLILSSSLGNLWIAVFDPNPLTEGYYHVLGPVSYRCLIHTAFTAAGKQLSKANTELEAEIYTHCAAISSCSVADISPIYCYAPFCCNRRTYYR